MKEYFVKFSSTVLIVIVLCGAFVFSYISVPVVVYAEEQEYVNVDNEEDALAGVIAYLNYRGLGFLSNDINAVRALLSDSQVELSELYDLMKKTPAGILRFTYNAQALLKLNQLAQKYIDKYGLLNYNSDSEPVENYVYRGKIFTDDNSNSCLVYVINNIKNFQSGDSEYNIDPSRILATGSYLKYPNSFFTLGAGKVTLTINYNDGLTKNIDCYQRNADVTLSEYNGYVAFLPTNKYQGCFSVLYDPVNHTYFFGTCSLCVTGYYSGKYTYCAFPFSSGELPDTDIKVYTPKGVKPAPEPDEPVTPKKSTGNTYNYNQTTNYIDNSVHNIVKYYSDDDDPVNPDDPDDPDDPESSGCDHTGIESRLDQIKNKLDKIIGLLSSPSDWSIPDPSDIDLHDYNFSLPVQLEHYFPFCIPFDLLLLFKALDVDPQAPRFQGTVHFRVGQISLYDWPVDIDFTPYNDIATKVRAVEFIGFLLFLMILTGKLFKG